MLQAFFHAWERRLAAATTDRVIRPFEWGLDWMRADPAQNGASSPERSAAATVLSDWVSQVMTDTDAFFTPTPTREYSLARAAAEGEQLLAFPSAFVTPHPENNVAYVRLFSPKPTNGSGRSRSAVLVLPQWNSDAGAADPRLNLQAYL